MDAQTFKEWQDPEINAVNRAPTVSYTHLIVKIGYNEMQAVINHFQYEDFKNAEYNERAEHDNARFLNLQPVNVDIKTDISKAKPISDMLIGVFFEDLSHAADGGLYAELIQNRAVYKRQYEN